MNRIALAGIVGTALLLGACGGASEEPASPDETAAPETPVPAEPTDTPTPDASASADATPTPTPSASVAAAVTAPAAFNQCKVCHAVEKGKHGLGPSLAGIYGTKAGDIAGFEFSTAMKQSGLVWNEANLDRYLAAPSTVVPGTKMTFPGLKDAAKRKEVIDYIKSL